MAGQSLTPTHTIWKAGRKKCSQEGAAESQALPVPEGVVSRRERLGRIVLGRGEDRRGSPSPRAESSPQPQNGASGTRQGWLRSPPTPSCGREGRRDGTETGKQRAGQGPGLFIALPVHAPVLGRACESCRGHGPGRSRWEQARGKGQQEREGSKGDRRPPTAGGGGGRGGSKGHRPEADRAESVTVREGKLAVVPRRTDHHLSAVGAAERKRQEYEGYSLPPPATRGARWAGCKALAAKG